MNIITTTMTASAAAATITTRSMSIITTTMMTSAAAAMITTMSIIITTMTSAAVVLNHHHHHADEVFTSWGQETVKTFTKEQIEGILKKLSEDTAYGMVLRAKGMVAGADGQWIYFDMVPEEYEVRDGAPEFTGRICVIGSKLAEDKLAELFGL